jgi:hypothetical protein
MVIVDTSVWVHHFRHGNESLLNFLGNELGISFNPNVH